MLMGLRKIKIAQNPPLEEQNGCLMNASYDAQLPMRRIEEDDVREK
jgi:hypothetical protein